jgi:hypothetical protein
MECRKCTYFTKKKNLMAGGTVVVGFCKLRQKHISDTTVGKELCKDRAVIDVDPAKLKKNEEIRLQDLSAKVWAGKKGDEITA